MSRPSSSNPWTKVAIFSKCQAGTPNSSAQCLIRPYHSERTYNDRHSVTAYNPGFRITTTDRRGTTKYDRLCVDHLKDHDAFRRIIRENNTNKPEDPSDLHTYLAHNYLAWPPERSSSPQSNFHLKEEDAQTLKNAEYLLRGFDRPLEAAGVATTQKELTNCPMIDQTRSEYVKAIGKWSKSRCLHPSYSSRIRLFCPQVKIVEGAVDSSSWNEGYVYKHASNDQNIYTRGQMLSATTPSRMAGRSTSLLGSARTVVREASEDEDEEDEDDLGSMVCGVSTFGDDDNFIPGSSVRAGSQGYTSSPPISRRSTWNA